MDPKLMFKRRQNTDAQNKKCQKCYETTHWSYECTKERKLLVRPTRTAIMKKRLVENPEGKVVIVPPQPPKQKSDSTLSDGRKRNHSSSDESDSSSDTDSSSSSSSSSDSDSSSSSSTSSSSSSSGSSGKIRSRKKIPKKK